MAESKSLSQRWQEYRPTKGMWLWSCVAAVVLTMIVGFTAGGWVTGGTAESMAAGAREEARESLVASICVNRFVAAPEAQQNLQALKDASSWQRDDLIDEGGWATLDLLEEQVSGAADLCADRLVAMEQIPTAAEPAAILDQATVDG
ncbi:hypothetical protein [Chelativorans salis]|uniref:Uncharacterized protein n=1 Tax=Chelativorans salis TaxID=2978478 RepID=A0ABT2LRL9_9HYPH|nr:hypothetical protein [Chelativorans sp. EGI FJ00035]MCT7376008.1 hypothetical protein [Chelativorans sp. EGI FJ00035]